MTIYACMKRLCCFSDILFKTSRTRNQIYYIVTLTRADGTFMIVNKLIVESATLKYNYLLKTVDKLSIFALKNVNLDVMICGVTHLLRDFEKHLFLMLSQKEHLSLSVKTPIPI